MEAELNTVRLIAISGMRYAPKVDLTLHLADYLLAQGRTVTLLDNTEKAITLNHTQKQRFVGGCVCCSLASSLIPTVWKLDTEYALLAVGASADPATLAHVLHTVQNTRVRSYTIALLDRDTQAKLPYVAQNLRFYADRVLEEPFEYDIPALINSI